jgi:NCAIR mutase (PurE)-related protein
MQEKDHIAAIFARVADGELLPEAAAAELKFAPFKQMMDGVTVDTHRHMRTGMPETVLAHGKSVERLITAVSALSGDDGKTPVMASRVSPEQGASLQKAFADGIYWPEAAIFCRSE